MVALRRGRRLAQDQFHSQVSPNSPVVLPPKRTTLFPSVAIAACWRRFSSGTSVQVAGAVACARAVLAIEPTTPTAASAVTNVRTPLTAADGTSPAPRLGSRRHAAVIGKTDRTWN